VPNVQKQLVQEPHKHHAVMVHEVVKIDQRTDVHQALVPEVQTRRPMLVQVLEMLNS
jgi:hypothetical protein